jgi:hypothetical protein
MFIFLYGLSLFIKWQIFNHGVSTQITLILISFLRFHL